MNYAINKDQQVEEQAATIKSKFIKYDSTRQAVLERARDCAALTIPSLLPPSGATGLTPLPTPYQSQGAEGVNNLASKLLLALLPPNQPFFRLSVSDKVLADLQVIGQKAEIEDKLAQIEREIMLWIETSSIRVSSFEALKLLIVTGNTLEYLPLEGGMKVFRLDQYVVKRDPMGNLVELIIKESVNIETLSEDIQKLALQTSSNELTSSSSGNEKNVDLYTWVRLKDQKWLISQEINGNQIPSSEGSYSKDELPWIALRWTAVHGEDYGRGLVEEYLGDFNALDGLMECQLKLAAAASKVVFLTDPNGTTNARDLNKAKSGDFVQGRKEDVTCLQVDKYYDSKVNQEIINKLELRLSRAFLLVSSIQRDAERVTAEEIRQMAKELEDTLGGVYSVLSQEKQLPLVRLVMLQMKHKGSMPTLPKNIVKPVVVTGLEALGRGNDLTKLSNFLQLINQLPNAVQTIKTDNVILRIATALGLETDGLVKTAEELAAEQQQAMMANMMQSATPGVAQEMTKAGLMTDDNNSE